MKKIIELKQTIEQLELRDAELCAKIEGLNADIEVESSTQSEEASRLNEEIKVAAEAVKYGTSVNTLVDLLKSYDDSLDKAINGSVKVTIETGDAGEVASQKMDSYLLRARNYFLTESQCVDFLRSRIQASENEVSELVSGLCLSQLVVTCIILTPTCFANVRKSKLRNVKVLA